MCDNDDIPKSPHISHILPRTDFHPEFVKVSGPGFAKTGVTIGQPTEFTVDTRKAGNAPLEVKIQDVFGQPIPFSVKDKPDGTKLYTYTPKSSLPHTVEVNYGGVATPDSPQRVYISAPLDPTKVHQSMRVRKNMQQNQV